MRTFEYYKPLSVNEALELKRKIPGSRYIAGGTDMMVRIHKRTLNPSALISLRSITELSGIEVKDTVRIGAATPIADLISHPELRSILPLLVQAAGRLGSVQIRNVGTIGGNICNASPCADTALALLALDAVVVIHGASGPRKVRLQNFFMGPGQSCLSKDEILIEILIGKPSVNTKAMFMKKGRVKLDLAIASVAILLEMEGDICRKARLAAGSVAPVPLRLTKAESLFESSVITRETLGEAQKIAMESVSPITDVRSTEDYRRRIVGVYLKRGVEDLLGWAKV